ncbi:MAG: hypothetical protein WAU21_13940 [Chitinophagales bacterium]|nr:hypothetical protein [Bacteroidota bacterium]MBK8488357.1 hypothetical protein [Bacteroidota bacterium]MBK8681879.1 hypothetical protein [Bacteroidota bacterium]MBP9549672.1 hypothetical protein [Chitinophagales bacterium]MBP9703303.1 hypothetical protein [Chitinophagales bacterium]
MQIRQATAFGFIILYLIAISYPSILNCSYTLNKTYISNNICVNRYVKDSTCDGKCYLMEQLNQHTDGQNTNPTSTPVTTQIYEVPAHLTTDLVKPFFRSETLISFLNFETIIPKDFYPELIIPPPQSV